MMRSYQIIGALALVLTAACVWAEPVVGHPAAPQAKPGVQPAADAAIKPAPAKRVRPDFDGYDFEHVVKTLNTSVDPLQKELAGSLKVFVESVGEADRLLDEGKPREAVQQCAAAIDGVLESRQRVMKPMWEAQEFLQKQIGEARARLAKALAAGDQGKKVKPSERVESTLNGIASRIDKETDPLRKKRLIAHYRTVRNLAQIREMAMQMSPDKRTLWANVLKILDEAGLAHQQVVMGSEVLFAQFEATSRNLNDYLSLMGTVDGASDLIGVLRGVDGKASGMTAFAKSMTQLQQRLAGFNSAVEGALQKSLADLEVRVEALQPAGESSGIASSQIDDELASRILRINKTAE